LFDARGEVNQQELPMIFDEARMLNARFLKLPLGSFQPEFSRAELASFLRSSRGIEFPIPSEEFEKRTREYVTQLERA
jgi:hypothetical protein